MLFDIANRLVTLTKGYKFSLRRLHVISYAKKVTECARGEAKYNTAALSPSLSMEDKSNHKQR